MASRTTRRNTFSVSADNDDFNISYYNQAEFKGINTNKNDILADAATFADANNVYVDYNSVLVSRPPVKLVDDKYNTYILREWIFGRYEFRLSRYLLDDDNNIIDAVQDFVNEWEKNNPEAADSAYDHLRYSFVIRCMSHDTFSGDLPDGTKALANLSYEVPYESIGNRDIEPANFATQIEDKVYFWLAGQYLYDFNCAGKLTEDGERVNYFEDATKYIYFPIHELVINGIKSTLETKNFLTSTYRRRYQYSQLSSINFDTIVGRDVSVYLTGDMTQDQSSKLYDTTIQQNQKLALIYPYSDIGKDYVIDMTVTSRAKVFMRFNITTKGIEVSFDGRYFRPLPQLDGIIGEPLLTRDGFYCIAFTTKGVAECQLIALTTDDIYTQNDYFSWTIVPYMQNNIKGGAIYNFTSNIDTSFTPRGYFETIDNFAYVFKVFENRADMEGSTAYLYSEWLHGTDDMVCGSYEFTETDTDGNTTSTFEDGSCKVAFKYVAPTQSHEDVGAVVALLHGASNTTEVFIFGKSNNSERTFRNGDTIAVPDEDYSDSYPFTQRLRIGRVQKVNSDGKTFDTANEVIHSGDYISIVFAPRDVNVTVYNDYTNYKKGDLCTYKSRTSNKSKYTVYKCKQDCVAQVPTNTTYWEVVSEDWRQLYYDANADTQFTDANIPGSTSPLYSSVIDNFNGNLLSEPMCIIVENPASGGVVAATGKPLMIGDSLRSYQTLSKAVTYTADELQQYMGDFEKDSAGPSNINSWGSFKSQPLTRGISSAEQIFITKLQLIASSDGSRINQYEVKTHAVLENVDTASIVYNAADMDIQIVSPIMSDNNITYTINAVYYLSKAISSPGTSGLQYVKHIYNTSDETWTRENKSGMGVDYTRKAKLYGDNDVVLTDRGIWFIDDTDYTAFPDNGLLSPNIDDSARLVVNNDTISLYYEDESGRTQEYTGNIHNTHGYHYLTGDKITVGGNNLAWKEYAKTAEEFLTPDYIYSGNTIAEDAPYYHIYTPTARANGWSYSTTRTLNPGVLCTLEHEDNNVILYPGDAGNPGEKNLTVKPTLYPAAPDDWTVGDDWPNTSLWRDIPKPFVATGDNTHRVWQAGDMLPTGAVAYWGYLRIKRVIEPLFIDSTGVWLLIDGQLWTSQPTEGNIVEVDEYVDCDYVDGNMTPRVNYLVPTHMAILNESFFSFVKDGKNLLEVTVSRRDEDKLFSEEGNDLLLYLPEINEQIIANKITALHNLSDTAMGLFTEDAVYYVMSVERDTGGVVYTKPIKSKIPVGLRDGDKVMTALDGQAIIFPLQRGLATLSPEDFVATTERSISYLSDPIQDLYADFYTNKTESLTVSNKRTFYDNRLATVSYKYWICLWKEFDKRIYLLDTRTGTWWKWTTPYPIRQIYVNDRLHIIQNIVFNPYTELGWLTPPAKAPHLGIDCIVTDNETEYDYVNDKDFPYLGKDKIVYEDDIIDGALNGDITYTADNFQQLYYAEPQIAWHVVSQKLVFAPNYYKKIRQIIMSAKGTQPISTKLSTKVFRDLVHPEQSTTMEIKINDLRTFVKYVNFMHVVYFQYRLENDKNVKTDNQLRLNMLGIKYEVKENIR